VKKSGSNSAINGKTDAGLTERRRRRDNGRKEKGRKEKGERRKVWGIWYGVKGKRKKEKGGKVKDILCELVVHSGK